MSIASMVDTKMALQRGVAEDEHSPAKPIGVSTGIVDQITRWIPTETITAYVALLALLAPLSGHAPSYESRWVLLGIVAAANPVVVVLLAMAKNERGDKLSVPVFEMFIAPIAFAAWAFALPDTPLSSIATTTSNGTRPFFRSPPPESCCWPMPCTSRRISTRS
jgi:hypothetical protein